MENNQLKSPAEKMAIRVFEKREEASVYVARQIASLITERNKINKPVILGLPTGNTPVPLYSELIRMHREEGLSFKNVITFNLDEYFPMSPDDSHSYYKFMYNNLFAHIDINPDHVHIPKGMLPIEEVEAFCADYDNKIEALGGIDIQVLGIGRSGHVGFNEPGTLADDGTHLVTLNKITINDAADDFGGAAHVPSKAITMGVKTILGAKKIYLLAWGNAKAEIVRQAVEGPVSSDLPATFLQAHGHCMFVLDTAAASLLNGRN